LAADFGSEGGEDSVIVLLVFMRPRQNEIFARRSHGAAPRRQLKFVETG
jgi:hypothetical protein